MMLRRVALPFAAFACVLTAAAQTPQWQQRIDARHAELIAQNGPGTDAALRDQLLAMRAEDQQVRFHPTGGEPVTIDKLRSVDADLTARLKAIVATDGWPTIHMVGAEASDGAMLILIHTPDHAWQHAMLPQLETLAAANKIDGAQLATLVDKELIAEGKPQRYGTQFKFVDGSAMMYAVEDPAHLAERRSEALLPPIEVYRQQLAERFHVPVSDMIVRPGSPAN